MSHRFISPAMRQAQSTPTVLAVMNMYAIHKYPGPTRGRDSGVSRNRARVLSSAPKVPIVCGRASPQFRHSGADTPGLRLQAQRSLLVVAHWQKQRLSRLPQGLSERKGSRQV